MRLALWLGNQQPWPQLLARAQLAESLGFQRLYIADHLMGDGGDFGADTEPTWESTAALAMLAASTTRISLGHMVASVTFRPVGVFAKWAATVAVASGGRLVVGLGAGWQVNEHSSLGLALGTPGERVRRLEETCRALRALWVGDVGTRTTMVGDFVQLIDAVHEPKPRPAPPLLVGGKGPRLLRVVARHADEWNTWSTPTSLPTRLATLEQACVAEGRNPATVAKSTQALLCLTDSAAEAERFVEQWAPRPALAGTAEQLAAAIGAWAQLDVDEVVVPDWTLPTDPSAFADTLASLHAAFTTPT